MAIFLIGSAALALAIATGLFLYLRSRRPPPAPACFDTETAAVDWGAPGRQIDVVCEERGDHYAQRQMLLTVRGWTFSAIWGFGSYSTAGRLNMLGDATDAPSSSPDAEIAVWKGEGGMIDLDGESVEGWVPPRSLAAAISAVEHGGGKAAIQKTIRRTTPD